MNKRFMRFPEGKKKALTLSYDDCMEEDIDLPSGKISDEGYF